MDSLQFFLAAVGLLLLLLFLPIYAYYVIKLGTLGYLRAKSVFARLEGDVRDQGEKDES
jgi:hypothetical protein